MKTSPVIFPFLFAGPPAFIAQVQEALSKIYMTQTGKALIRGIADTKHTVTIGPTADANGYCKPENPGDAFTPGRGSNSTIYWNPEHHTAAPDDIPGSAVILGGLLVHALHNAKGIEDRKGDLDRRPTGTLNPYEERSVIGASPTLIINPAGRRLEVPDFSERFPTENRLRQELGVQRRNDYYPINWPGGPPW